MALYQYMSAKYRVFEIKVQTVQHENYHLHCLLNANGSFSLLGSEKQSIFHKGYCSNAWGLGKA